MVKQSAVVLVTAAAIFSPSIARSQDTAPPKQEPAPSTSVAPASVEITPKTIDAHVGEKIKFSAAAKDAAGNAIDEKPSVWFAAPFDLAGADESGEVTFHAPGRVTVGAVIAGKAGYATVNVENSKIATLEIVPPAYPTVSAGSTEKLIAITRTSNGNPRTDAAIKWSSEKPAIASVDAAGLVTGIAPGSVAIKATSETVSATVTLHVMRDTVRKLIVQPASAEARTGDVVHFNASAFDGAGNHLTNSAARWSISGTKAAVFFLPLSTFVHKMLAEFTTPFSTSA